MSDPVLKHRKRKPDREVFSVRIDKNLRKNFLQSCENAELNAAEVVETLIAWFLAKENPNA